MFNLPTGGTSAAEGGELTATRRAAQIQAGRQAGAAPSLGYGTPCPGAPQFEPRWLCPPLWGRHRGQRRAVLAGSGAVPTLTVRPCQALPCATTQLRLKQSIAWEPAIVQRP